MLVFIAGLFVISIGFTLWLSLLISGSISAVRNAAVEITKGNMDVQINTSGKDEVGELSQAIDKMRISLKTKMKETSLANKKSSLAQKALQDKLLEVEAFNKIAVGRELRKIELKEEVEKHEKSLHKKSKKSPEGDDETETKTDILNKTKPNTDLDEDNN